MRAAKSTGGRSRRARRDSTTGRICLWSMALARSNGSSGAFGQRIARHTRLSPFTP